ncbi:hypothetical protein PCC8801_4496 (plasmid) [Rippkaea orientalis PCC 8801]|uniref:Uncharacterized protein n=1 Tax=Rippkaea orientalis (strain PCC 8801 / RF-1) TaxID=41431 RepID=B7K6I7_RIPO1|nr:hypothetical protein [Rippkaea orientalis]ACK68409.1 hypothetical protein PCC8801_4496 [Rippkaea orientalis PCC 8801]
MLKPPSPPTGANEYLSQLANYYRELVEYHQQAAMAAAQQLGHVEALLSNKSAMPLAVETQSWLVAEPETTAEKAIGEKIEDKEELDEDEEDENDLEQYHVSLLSLDDEDDENELEQYRVSLLSLKELLEAERGKMLHIDYIVKYFYDCEVNIAIVKPRVEEKLEEGEQLKLWSSVPDAPDCWTFTLADFFELAPKEERPSSASQNTVEKLSTKKVAEKLSIPREKIYEIKTAYPGELIKGVDYFYEGKRGFLWSESGQEKLKNLSQRLKMNRVNEKKNRQIYSSDIAMLKEYKGLSKLKAIEKFFKNNPGKAVSITEVIEALYGQLNPSQKMIIRETIGKALSAGKKRGLWRNVPTKIGFYQSN